METLFPFESENLIKRYMDKINYLQKKYSKTLSRYLEIEPYINEELERIRKRIIEEQKKGNKIAIVCMTGDLAHPGHISYIKTAREKIKSKFNIPDDKLKLFVGLETSKRTVQRKGKKTILSDDERKYQWQHIKGVDDAFIRDVKLDLYPSDLMLHLEPNFRISHEEYFDNLGKYLRVSRKLKYGTSIRTKIIIVGIKDPNKFLPEGDLRGKWNLSTTNLALRVLENQLPSLLKKYPQKVLNLLKKYNVKTNIK